MPQGTGISLQFSFKICSKNAPHLTEGRVSERFFRHHNATLILDLDTGCSSKRDPSICSDGGQSLGVEMTEIIYDGNNKSGWRQVVLRGTWVSQLEVLRFCRSFDTDCETRDCEAVKSAPKQRFINTQELDEEDDTNPILCPKFKNMIGEGVRRCWHYRNKSRSFQTL